MTHHTDAERAELRKAIESALDGVHIEDGTTYWFERIVEEVTTAVMSARRAPAAPVPQGLKLVPEKSTEAMARAFRADDAPGYFFMTTLRCADFAERYAAMLAAAPQTPEAAPVQLPEPVAWMLWCQTLGGDAGWKLSWSQSGAGVCNRLAGKEFEHALYTEQQVRQLLAAHGIK